MVFIPFESFNQSEYDLLVEEGLTLLELGKYNEAINVYRQALLLDSLRVEAYYGLGVSNLSFCKQNLDLCSESISLLDKVIRMDSNYRKAYYYRGSYKSILGDFISAESDFSQAIRHDSTNEYYYYVRAFVKTKLNDTIGGCEDLQFSCSFGYKIACVKLFELCND